MSAGQAQGHDADATGGWPSPPPADQANIELLKILYTAQVAEAATQRATRQSEMNQGWQRELTDKADDAALFKSEHDAMLTVAQASIDRGRSGAESVRNAAAAIGSLYTSLLGVSFAVDKNHPLPATGVIPAVFLGLAIVFSTAYVAFIWPGRSTTRAVGYGGTLRAQEDARMATFIAWTSEIAQRRAWTLHLAVFSLGVGIAALPLPFVSWHGAGPWIAAVAALALIGLATSILARRMATARSAVSVAEQSPGILDG